MFVVRKNEFSNSLNSLSFQSPLVLYVKETKQYIKPAELVISPEHN